ncbi:hypothetical protein [Humibacillus xanthopallidus]|uniref:Uncharacterized protein n=1 Tax=Humibacillus xanthopallidus TaxID=412689 RepID=A0A543I2L1_9MICO|nr:hypothetical protein [Humibacillus xanthopallidus]TQM64781.1 hypothetical protein FBY41_1160 [Humibacillus xanthopallidus]
MSRIPPQGARMVGAWPSSPAPQTRSTRNARADRSPRAEGVPRSTWFARLLHPLHRPVPARLIETAGPTTQQPARHA